MLYYIAMGQIKMTHSDVAYFIFLNDGDAS